jgi:polyhydroxybutyrate depolymerase
MARTLRSTWPHILVCIGLTGCVGQLEAGSETSRGSAQPDEADAGHGTHDQAPDGDDSPQPPGDGDAEDPQPESDAGIEVLQGPSGPSAGCAAATSMDGTDWVKHDLLVSGMAARYRVGGDDYGVQSGYDFEHRNYFVRLPENYDPAQPYPLLISGGGCGATSGTSGDSGGANPLSDGQDIALQVGLSYVYPDGGGACFQDDGADTPDLAYFDAVLAELDQTYCFDRGRVFVSGFSSGAWESYMLACARGGVVRGIGTQAGGLRRERPACSHVPVAAFLTAGVNDANPIQHIEPDGFDSGSEAARDVILATNGCQGTASEPYVTEDAHADWNCQRYTGCPAAYPVVWCAITADGGGHGAGSPHAFWPFWSALPGH